MFIFFGDAIVSFNEIIALINKTKWVWNGVAFKLFVLISESIIFNEIHALKQASLAWIVVILQENHFELTF